MKDSQEKVECCPINNMLDIVSAKWTVEILRELALGPVRTRRFLRLIPGLSMKSLQERLKVLQTSGLISRVQYDEKLPHVEHSITERGKRLYTVICELKEIAGEVREVTCKCPMEGYCETDMQCPNRRVF